MYVTGLEIAGFKSFAKKTTLDFPNGITAVVGPNGSGKSNIADAIRWVLAEQSFKNLRSRKGEDLIFHGSIGRGSLSRARVAITFADASRAGGIDIPEVHLERTVSKTGDNSYRMNGRAVRLMDLESYLAKTGIGGGSFRVLSQGMSDMLITLGPKEFREFIEDAAGVREFQDKRHRSFLKMQATRENLEQVAGRIAELVPRLKFLKRENAKLAKRTEVESGLRSTARALFGYRYGRLTNQANAIGKKQKTLDEHIERLQAEIAKLESALFSAAPTEQSVPERAAVESELRALEREREEAVRTLIELDALAQTEKERRELKIPFTKSELVRDLTEIANLSREAEEGNKQRAVVSRIREKIEHMLEKLARAGAVSDADKAPRERERAEYADRVRMLEAKITNLRNQEHALRQAATDTDDLRRRHERFREAHKNLRALESERNSAAVEEEKIKIRREELDRDIRMLGIVTLAEAIADIPSSLDEEKEEARLFRLKNEFDAVGKIDPAVADEYKGVLERFEFLEREKSDLVRSLQSLEAINKDLEVEIEKRFTDTLEKMSEGFASYFRLMFGGGKAGLSLVRSTGDSDDSEAGDGIEISVELPGKKVKNLHMLSGGERTLVSIALLFALVTIRRPPFLVLDEIDAALDETNSERFIRLVRELARDTQFIIITHNRSTMAGADAIYGVAMKNGISQLLSITLEESGSAAER